MDEKQKGGRRVDNAGLDRLHQGGHCKTDERICRNGQRRTKLDLALMFRKVSIGINVNCSKLSFSIKLFSAVMSSASQ